MIRNLGETFFLTQFFEKFLTYSKTSAGFGVYVGENQVLPHQGVSSGIAPKPATIHRAHLPASSADCR
jgi:hypothetical protein